MSEQTRREFIKSGAALAAVAGVPVIGRELIAQPYPQGRDGLSPDFVLLDAKVYTVDDAQPTAEAFAVKGDRFVAVGSNDEIRSLAGRGTAVIDAEGMTVTPGFIDAHSHPGYGGINELTLVNLDLRSIAEIQAALRAKAAQTPPGEWIVGFKFDDTKVREGRRLTRADLDEAVPNHPVQVGHRGGHTSWYNSMAFELAGITAETPDPPDGRYGREGGELTGFVAEAARAPLSRLIPRGTTREQRQAGVKLITELMSAAGLTSVTDASVSPQLAAAYQDARVAGELKCRVYMMLGGGSTYEVMKDSGLYTGLGDEWLRVGGVKFFADGSASERTMRMSTPYVGRPDDYGILTMTQEEIHEVVEEAHRNRWQVGIHANGDVAIDMVLNAYERVQEMWPRPDPRHRLEHCSLVNPDLLRRIKAVGAIPTPFYTYAHYHGNKWVEYGPEKMRWMFAHKSFLDYDIPVASASDYVPGPYEPLMAIQSMVTRKDFDGRVWGPNQRVTPDQALRICTINAAHAAFEEGIKGSITAGKLADFVILAEDFHEVDPDRIKEIQVVRTVVGGKTVHEA
jgi:predicted amidohydrolase YtcJ